MEDKKTMCREFLRAFANGNVDGVTSRVSDDFVLTTKGTSIYSATRTLPEVVELSNVLNSLTTSEFTAEFPSMTEEDDRVAVEMEGHAELVGGTTYNNVYHFLFRFRDGKISSINEYLDTKYLEELIAPAVATVSASVEVT